MARNSSARKSKSPAGATPPKPSAKSKPPATPSNLNTPGYLNALQCSPNTRTEESTRQVLTENDAKNRYERKGKESQMHVAGPMPLDPFFEDFVSYEPNADNMPEPEYAFDAVPQPNPKQKGEPQERFKESQMNEPLAQALNGPLSHPRCPGIKFVNTGDRGDGIFGSKPDISAYLVEAAETVAKAGLQQLFVEIKLRDFACDNPAKGEGFLFNHLKDGKERSYAKAGFGQQLSYATEICAQQHRNFLFSIFMTPTRARFLRWDRAGVVISESFDFRKDSHYLCKFLWRIGKMSHEQRGGDTSVVVATKEEEKLFRRAIQAHVRSQVGSHLWEEEYKRHYERNAVTKIPVRKSMIVKAAVGTVQKVKEGTKRTNINPRSKGKQKEILPEEIKAEPKELVSFDANAEQEEFLVSRPVASPLSLASRGTRGYWAVRVKDGTVHFLKDAWRTDVDNMEIEGRILEKLADKKVRNVPTVLCWSDVGPTIESSNVRSVHCTQTNTYATATWNKHKPEFPLTVRFTRRVHYRQVTQEAGYTLEQLAGTYELLNGARNVFEALHDAHTKCNRLHRDISSTNIILYAASKATTSFPKRKAILADWELSIEDVPGDPRDHWISGTWAFMAINTLMPPQKRRRYHVADDMESIIYVVFYCAITFLGWKTYTVLVHQDINQAFFAQANLDLVTGGNGKATNASMGGVYFDKVTIDFVSEWLVEAYPMIFAYARRDMKSLPEEVFDAYNSVFEHEAAYWQRLPMNNRKVNELPRTGAPPGVFPATTVSSSRNQPGVQSDLLANVSPAAAPSQGGSLKRDHKVVDVDEKYNESSSKRKKSGNE